MSKQRVSVTLDESIVRKVDSESDRRGFNRSQTVEKILKKHFSGRGLDTAVVLCGDDEKRSLRIIEGKPVLSHILDNLEEEGVNRVILLIGRNEEIRDSFGSEYSDLVLDYITEEDPSGTASALENVAGMVQKEFVVLNGHVIADVDLDDMLRMHREENHLATMALTAVEDPSDYGVAKLKGREIKGFASKPEKGEEPSRLINAGTYIFDPSIFRRLGKYESLSDVFDELSQSSELSGYIYGGEWREVQE